MENLFIPAGSSIRLVDLDEVVAARTKDLREQRDRLMAYVRAERRLRSCPPSLRRARLHLQYQAALRALRDAGDVTADDAQRDLGDAA